MASGQGRSRKDLLKRRREAQRRADARRRGGAGEGDAAPKGAGGEHGGRSSSTKRYTSASRLRRHRRLKKGLIVAAAVLALTLLLAGVAFARLSRGLPDLGDVNRVATFQTTRIFDAKGKTIASLAGEGNRVIVSEKVIPQHLRQAVVATEDRRFYTHPAVDILGVARAAWTNVVRRSVVQGGSTITQQYVKNAYFSPRRTLERKVKELILAYRLEKRYKKDQILAKYLNTIYFGEGAYGVEAAAQTYFGRHAKHLTLPQSALLAGLIRSPARYSPFKHPEAAKNRRRHVLDRMLAEGYISREEADAAAEAALPATRTPARSASAAPYFVDHIAQRLVELVGEQAAFSGGLKVYTTLDLDLQKLGEEAIAAELDQPDDPSASLVALDPRSGAVRVMIGGRDYKRQQYNMATQGRRQAGSAFKTFVLAAAISSGISPDQYFESDSPASFEVTGAPDWKVTNYEGKGYGHISLADATVRSVNVAYANVMMRVGPDAVIRTAKAMGITSPLNSDPAIALGGLKHGVNTLEMASAYGSLATGGIRAVPYTIERVVSADGQPVRLKKAPRRRALDAAVAYLTTKTLEEVVDHGTGTGADIGRPQAGKTGTAQNYVDAWFVGFVPQMSTAVWVGYPESQVPMRNVHGRRVSGGSFPAAIWKRFMEKALANHKALSFPPAPPGSIVWRQIDPITGYLASPYCPQVDTAPYPKGLSPKSQCPVHTVLVVPKVVGMSQAAAEAKLDDLGLEASVTVVASDAPKGQVVGQSPAAGTKAERGDVVRIQVSDGKGEASAETSRLVVPAVVGLPLTQAKAKLSAAGLKYSVAYVESKKPADQVVGADPSPGSTVAKGSMVALSVSVGPNRAKVPRVVGLSQTAAAVKLEGAGFTVSIQKASKSESEGHKAGTVLRQDPAGGTIASLDEAVTIWVARKT